MVAYATVPDVEAIWRPLTSAEVGRVQVLLDYASDLVRQAVPRVDDWVADGSLAASAVRYVVVQMVYRFMLNPEGHRQGNEAIDDYSRSWTLHDVVAAGGLSLSEDLLAWLRPAGQAPSGAFTVRPWQAPLVH